MNQNNGSEQSRKRKLTIQLSNCESVERLNCCSQTEIMLFLLLVLLLLLRLLLVVVVLVVVVGVHVSRIITTTTTGTHHEPRSVWQPHNSIQTLKNNFFNWTGIQKGDTL